MAQEGVSRRLASNAVTQTLAANPRLLAAVVLLTFLIASAGVSTVAGELIVGVETAPEMTSTAHADGPQEP
jgi:hypothetical protein